MNELELLRRDYAAVPEPDDPSVARALDRLQQRQASLARPGFRTPRRILVVALIIAATAVVAIERPVGHGVDVANAESPAAAGFRALSARSGIWHFRSRVSLAEGSRVIERDVTEGWSTARHLRWFARSVTERTPAGGSSFAEEFATGRCGAILWDGPGPGVLRFVSELAVPEPNPVADYRRAYLHGRVISQTAVSYRGIAAYRLVFDLGGWHETWTLRRGDYVPVTESGVETTIGPLPRSYSVTYTQFELLTPTAGTLAQLRPQPHPGASILRYGGRPRPGCTRFRG
jgi:hypothetical protein